MWILGGRGMGKILQFQVDIFEYQVDKSGLVTVDLVC